MVLFSDFNFNALSLSFFVDDITISRESIPILCLLSSIFSHYDFYVFCQDSQQLPKLKSTLFLKHWFTVFLNMFFFYLLNCVLSTSQSIIHLLVYLVTSFISNYNRFSTLIFLVIVLMFSFELNKKKKWINLNTILVVVVDLIWFYVSCDKQCRKAFHGSNDDSMHFCIFGIN